MLKLVLSQVDVVHVLNHGLVRMLATTALLAASCTGGQTAVEVQSESTDSSEPVPTSANPEGAITSAASVQDDDVEASAMAEQSVQQFSNLPGEVVWRSRFDNARLVRVQPGEAFPFLIALADVAENGAFVTDDGPFEVHPEVESILEEEESPYGRAFLLEVLVNGGGILGTRNDPENAEGEVLILRTLPSLRLVDQPEIAPPESASEDQIYGIDATLSGSGAGLRPEAVYQLLRDLAPTDFLALVTIIEPRQDVSISIDHLLDQEASTDSNINVAEGCENYRATLTARVMHYGLGKAGWGDELSTNLRYLDPELADHWDFVRTEDEFDSVEGVSIYNALEAGTFELCGVPLTNGWMQLDGVGGSCINATSGLSDLFPENHCQALDQLEWPCFELAEPDDRLGDRYQAIACATGEPVELVLGPQWRSLAD